MKAVGQVMTAVKLCNIFVVIAVAWGGREGVGAVSNIDVHVANTSPHNNQSDLCIFTRDREAPLQIGLLGPLKQFKSE